MGYDFKAAYKRQYERTICVEQRLKRMETRQREILRILKRQEMKDG